MNIGLLYNKNVFFEKTLKGVPVGALQFLKENKLEGNIFAPFHISGLIAYRYYPNLKIYMDGRQEQVYPYEIFEREMNFLDLKTLDSYKILEQYKTDIVLIEKEREACEVLKSEQKYFKPVLENEGYILFLSPELYRKLRYTDYKKQKLNKFGDFTPQNFFDTRLKFTQKQYKNIK